MDCPVTVACNISYFSIAFC